MRQSTDMYVFRSAFLAAALLMVASAGFVRGEEAPITISNDLGASVIFSEDGGTWSWTRLTTPNVPFGWSIADEGTPITSSIGTGLLAAGWSLVEQDGNKLVFEQDAVDTGLRFRRIFSFGPASNVLRIETWAQNPGDENVLTRAGLLDLRVDGETFRDTGAAPASFPVFGQSLFIGIEHVSGVCHAEDDLVHLWQTPHLKIGEAWQFVAAAVVGWPMPGERSLVAPDSEVREAFLQYLDTIRIKPANLELNTNTWWTLPLPFSETDVLRDIETLRKGFHERTGMFFDSFSLDLGWSDPKSIWRVDARRFPNELRTINESLAALGCRLGLWVSPSSGYPPGLDNTWLAANGYELTPFGGENEPVTMVACMALGGRYQAAFKESIVKNARDYGLRHVKLDFMAHTCDVASHGHPTGFDSYYAIDAGLADVLDSLRAVNPAMVLEPLCTGYPPSPWWLTKTPYVLGPHGDDVPYGRVPSPDWMESLISARDIAYRSNRDQWIMPSQALQTFDIVVQNPGNFENLAVMAIGRGRWFISTYLKPELMSPINWDFLAALVRWARANRQYLENAQMIGGKPENREAYGYTFHTAGKDITCVRNPWIEERSIQLPAWTSVQEPRDLRMIYPRRETVARLEPGAEGPWIVLAPYETVMLETIPVSETTPPATPRISPEAGLTANPPRWVPPPRTGNIEIASSVHYSWDGEISVPDVTGAELCILVEGEPRVSRTTCTVSLSGRAANVVKSGSEGQFGAAAAPSPENWTWFIVPVTPGNQSVRVEINIPLEAASFGIYLRGSTSAGNNPEPEEGPVFPVANAARRAWSQTLVPLKEYSSDAP